MERSGVAARSGMEQKGAERRAAFAELFPTGRLIIQRSERDFRVFTPSGNKTYRFWVGQCYAVSYTMLQCFAGAGRTSHRA